MKKNWYVVYTKSRCEKKVAELLQKREIENYCPLNRVIRNWSDRKKTILQPLFSSYVFVKSTEQELYKVKMVTTEIVNFVYWLGKPAVIKDVEINDIKLFLNEYSNVKLEKCAVNLGDKVRVLSGPLMNLEGNITSLGNDKVKLMLPSLGYSMIAEIRISNIEVINRPFVYDRYVS